jgi:hypothetical protein
VPPKGSTKDAVVNTFSKAKGIVKAAATQAVFTVVLAGYLGFFGLAYVGYSVVGYVADAIGWAVDKANGLLDGDAA